MEDESPVTDTEWRAWAADMEIRMGRVEDDLRENNIQTQEIHSIMTDARGFFRFLGHAGTVFAWVAKIGAGVAAVWALIEALRSGHAPPPPGA
jgi:hypothetical protein